MIASDNEVGNIVDVTAQNIQQTVLEASSKVPVLLDVWADWCEPCKALTPILEKLVAEYAGRFILAKLNADDQQELTAQLGVQSLPTLKLIVEGQIAGELPGLQPESAIRELLNQFVKPGDDLGADENDLLNGIRAAINVGDFQAAERFLQQGLAENKDDVALQYLAAELQIHTGELASAKERFNSFSQENKDSDEGKRLAALFYFNDIAAARPSEDSSAQQEKGNSDADHYYYSSAESALESNYDVLFNQAWHLFQKHMSYKSGEPKILLLKAFDLVGKSDPRTHKYRRKMFNFLH